MAKSSASHIKSLAQANKQPGVKGGKLSPRSVEFTGAENGLTSVVRHNRGEDGGMDYAADKTTIHPSMSHAVAHLKSTFGHVFESGEED